MTTGQRGSSHSAYKTLDDASLNSKHWLTVITAGMGFFTDAYDLFIIGTVTAILTPIWHLNTAQLSLLNSISLIAAVVGALTFGKLMDMFGRKAVYGIEVMLLVLGAVASAFSPNFAVLFAFRILVGIGVGGDYATSAVITSEYANRKNRGRLVGTVFAMQGFGLLAGPAVAAILLGAGMSHALAWRLMLGLGAIPAASVIYLRRKIKETPRYTLAVKGDVAATIETAAWVTGSTPAVQANGSISGSLAAEGRSNGDLSTGGSTGATIRKLHYRLTDSPFLLRLFGTAGTWFLMDIAFYGNSVSSPLILKALQPKATLLDNVLIAGAIFAVFAVPGYWAAVFLMDKMGRKRIQWQGFLVMALAFGAIAVIPGMAKNPWAFLVVFGISYFFIEFGPNETTFVYPSEIFPTSIRGAGDGISAAGGKTGAFLGALLVPTLLKTIHLSGVMGVMAGVSAIGLLLTIVALPEPMGRNLEDASGESIESGAMGTHPQAVSGFSN
ncbi:MAG: MFS transporter [Actinobacteria bacterium]|nr:MFS transporter [Actinomycetota bacterium]MCL5886586.1 MFS transporter [Actinomycetota bacterium]